MPINDSYGFQRVILQFPASVGAGRMTPLGSAGGFSGARIWQVQTPAEMLCLKAWPRGIDCEKRLSQVHAWMRLARRCGLEFVPRVFAAFDGQTWTKQGGRCWELCDWMPGKADFHHRPSQGRLAAACRALASLHQAWATGGWQIRPTGDGLRPTGDGWQIRPTEARVCPAIMRRVRCAEEWLIRLEGGWRPDLTPCGDDLKTPAHRAFELLSFHLKGTVAQLKAWTDRRFVCQPCLCDVWHDHVLFRGDTLSGIIDYGSMKIDNVAVDLARLLGSLVGDRQEWRRTGLAAYEGVRTLSDAERQLVDVLDETGTVLALANWLDRLFVSKTVVGIAKGAAERIEQICGRIEAWGAARSNIAKR